jgi:hypothetical protein
MVQHLSTRLRPLRAAACLLALLAAPLARAQSATGAPPAAAAAAATNLLEQARAAYLDRLDMVEGQFNDSVDRINEQYLAALDRLAKEHQAQGNLDAVLMVRAERTRFEDRGTIVERDVAAEPPELAPLQRSYVTALERLEQDRSRTRAAVGASFAEHLDKLIRALTQQGHIREASAASREREELAASLAARARPEAAEPATDAEPPATARDVVPEAPKPSEDAKLPKPPNDYVWFYVSKDGFPARSVPVVVEDVVEKKVSPLKTDASGKVAVYARKEGARLRAFVLSEGFKRAVVDDAVPGRSYALALAPAPEGTGFTPIRRTEGSSRSTFSIPDVGTFSIGEGWSSDGVQMRPVKTSEPDVKMEGSVHSGEGHTVIAGDGTFRVSKGGIRYRVAFFRGPGGAPYVEYSRD